MRLSYRANRLLIAYNAVSVIGFVTPTALSLSIDESFGWTYNLMHVAGPEKPRATQRRGNVYFADVEIFVLHAMNCALFWLYL